MAIRSVVPRNFVLGIKINAADYVATVCDDTHKDNLNPPDDALHHIRVIASWGLIDFIEISGGDYEKPGNNLIPFLCIMYLCSALNPRVHDCSQITPSSAIFHILSESRPNTLIPPSVPGLPSATYPPHWRPPHPRTALHCPRFQRRPPPRHRAGLCALPSPPNTAEGARGRGQS